MTDDSWRPPPAPGALLAAVGLTLHGCQPSAAPEEDPCIEAPPGGPFAARIVCGGMLFDGDGRPGDVLVGNDAFRAVIRHPNASLTAIGVGGGTVIDAAPWGRADELFEGFPLVAGGWLEVSDWQILDDGVRIAGVVRDLPDAPADQPGAFAEVTWRVDPERPVLQADGADGLLWFPRASAEPFRAGWIGQGTAFLPVGTELPADPPSAVRLPSSAIAVAPAEDPFEGPRRTGRAPGAKALELFDADGPLARVPVFGDPFAIAVPAGVTGVRAVARGAEPSPVADPSSSPTLALGPAGGVRLVPSDPGRPRWRLARWEGPEGPDEAVVPPEGAWLPVGDGPRTVHVTGGPEEAPQTLDVDGSARGTRLFAPRRAFDPGSRIRGAAGWPGERSRVERSSDRASLERAAAEGLDWVVLVGEDAVAGGIEDPPILQASGVRTTVGLSEVVSWAWPDRRQDAGWGAPDPRGLAPRDALAVLGDRQVVPLEHLASLGAPVGLDPAPFAVGLGPPGDDLAPWAPWLALLDAGHWVLPWGPSVWIDVDDPEHIGHPDVGQALAAGRLCASSGPVVGLAVSDGVARIELAWAGPFERVRLVGPGPTVLATWTDVTGPLETPVAPSRWWIAIAEADGRYAVALAAP